MRKRIADMTSSSSFDRGSMHTCSANDLERFLIEARMAIQLTVILCASTHAKKTSEEKEAIGK
jgi:hypothetical protein